jgi:2-polyprenyl-3-methyl-5-hydroxy-6-metoxy-1,4-benzoquinol methylase
MLNKTSDRVEESKAPREYWDSQWQEGELPAAIDPRNHSLKNELPLKMDAFFRQEFAAEDNSRNEAKLLEVGCARSAWLPYFSKEFGFQVAGIDYSAAGCDQARCILAKEGVPGQVTLADIFNPPAHLLNHFNYVVSFGVVEHFEFTDECVKSCGAFLVPGGTMLTVIPNMHGIVGCLQKWLVREVYDVHVPLDREGLRRAHEGGGQRVVSCEYFCFSNFGVLNLTKIRQSFAGLWFSRILNAISAFTWILERMGLRLPANRLTSPYIICVSTKAS